MRDRIAVQLWKYLAHGTRYANRFSFSLFLFLFLIYNFRFHAEFYLVAKDLGLIVDLFKIWGLKSRIAINVRWILSDWIFSWWIWLHLMLNNLTRLISVIFWHWLNPAFKFSRRCVWFRNCEWELCGSDVICENVWIDSVGIQNSIELTSNYA